MIKLRRKKLLLIGIPVLLLLFFLNHLEYHIRALRTSQGDNSKRVIVRMESGLSGHNTIGIDEKASQVRMVLNACFFLDSGRMEF